MKETKINVNPERNITVNLIYSTEFCAKILPILRPELFKSEYAKTIAIWVKDYYEHYHEAPKENIEQIYSQRVKNFDEEQANLLAEFFLSLDKNKDATPHNVEYQIETAIQYFKLRLLEVTKENLEEAIIKNDTTKGEAIIANFSAIGIPSENSVSIIENKVDIINAFTEENEPLFKFLGDVNKVVFPVMRGDLCAYIGKPKGQKTNALLHTAYVAATNECRVVFFSLEMKKAQVLRRFWQSIVGLPLVEGDYMVPYFDLISATDNDGMGLYAVDLKKEHFPALQLDDIEKTQKKLKRWFHGGDVRFITMPRFSATIDDLIYHLDNLMYYDNYVPDVVIVDYADILKPSAFMLRDDYRHRLNDIWMRLAALAQERNISIWTATQTNRSGLHGDIELDSIAEEFRKIAHVSMLIAINQTEEEKAMKAIRLKALIKRDEAVSDKDEVVVLQQLQLGKFYYDSKLIENVQKISSD